MLLGFGGILLLNSQLETDSDRMEELEEAVRQLSNEVGRLVDELTPQRGTRPARAVAAEKEKAAKDEPAAPRTRRTRAVVKKEDV